MTAPKAGPGAPDALVPPGPAPVVAQAPVAAPALVPATHGVTNQALPTSGYDAFSGDRALAARLAGAAPWAVERAAALGALVGDEEIQEAAAAANDHPPQLRTHDRWGRRIDRVELHPAWHRLAGVAFGHEVHSLAWTSDRPGRHLARAVLSYLWNQIENGIACPTGMAYAAAPGLADRPELAEWHRTLLLADHDPRPIPVAGKRACLIGYAMTEKQAGSDLRRIETRAVPVAAEGGRWFHLTGHKWFCSVPMADGFFTLARSPAGVSCLFVPRVLPDGTANPFLIQRLKDKCGNRSNPSAEIEYDGTVALLVGEEGRGIAEILSHAHLTRLDFAVGSAGLLRHALTLAIDHATTRRAFGRALVDHPAQVNVLADLAVECEAAMLLALRVAAALDGEGERERLLARLLTPVAKFWICQRAGAFVNECLQVHGGNGYVLEHPIARLHRESPLNAIWEGTSNMMADDVGRVLRREPAAADALLAELAERSGEDPVYDRAVAGLAPLLADAGEGGGRLLATRIALLVQAGQLLEHATGPAAELHLASRLGGGWAGTYGTLAPSPHLRAVVERATVVQR